ncbi:MAG: FAD-binding oxidoreductase [Alphaproteobacteria bacterium]|nr:FAD-binding oxidoreductase [Alphaproteobacteria bacterium]
MKEIKRFPAPVGDPGWFNLANNRQHQFAQAGDLASSYDFVIVGAGFAGIAAATRLAQLRPGASIAVFEALEVGKGDSGRNAGFMIDEPHAAFGDSGDLIHHKWRYRLNKIVIDWLRKVKTAAELDVDWRESGKHLAARESSCLPNLESHARLLDQIGIECKICDQSELTRTLGTDYYIKSLYSSGTVLINPSEVVRGIASALPQTVQVFERTPVKQVIEGAQPRVILSNGKAVSTSTVVLTVSSFINDFGTAHSGRMFGITSFGAFTRELSVDELKTLEGVEPWGCTAAHEAGTTVRYTPTKRVYVRNGLAFCGNQRTTPDHLKRAQPKLRKAFESRFPRLRHVEFENAYAGMIPLSYNTQSLFGRVAENVFAGSVGDGLGITRSNMLGLYLADLVCGVDSEELRYLLTTNTPGRCPPEPFRSIGANLRIAWSEFRAGGEI